MTNKEKYNDALMKILIHGGKLGVHKETGKPITCGANMNCCICKFFGGCKICSEEREKWFNEEYVEPKVDWSKVPVDTPVLVSKNGSTWFKRYFAGFDKGIVSAWNQGATSWSSDFDDDNTTKWTYAKLAESEENVE